jgi:hypothetical protein
MSVFKPIAPPHETGANDIVYILHEAGKIRGAEWIAAAGDEDAIAQARRFSHWTECELWQRTRKVARIAAASAATRTNFGYDDSSPPLALG